MVRYLLCTLCYFLLCSAVIAQPTFIVSSADVVPGEVFSVQVSAENMSSIVSMQYSLNWDPAVIEYEGVSDFGIPFLGLGNFGDQEAEEGRLGMNWFDSSSGINGITATEIDLYKIEFRAKEDLFQADTEIAFSGSPVSIEIADTSFMNIGMTPISSVVSVLDPTDVDNFQKTSITVGQNTPNPFRKETFIPVEVNESNELKIEIINLTGTLLYEYAEFIHPGLHKINIPGDIFPANGTYLCSVLIGEKKVAKKLFYNGK